MRFIGLGEFREEVREAFLIVKVHLSTVWFWIPVLFAAYIPFQMYLMFVNPFLLAIAPAALFAYLAYEEERGFRAKYQLDTTYTKTAREPIFWDVERFMTSSRNKKTEKKQDRQ